MNGRSKQMWPLVGLAMALSLGRITLAQAQARTVTTDRSIVINWFASDPNTGELVHFTASFELVARVYGDPDERPQIEGFLSAAGVQGKSDTRGIVIHWKPTGLYRFIGDPNLLPASFPVEATFPLLRAGPGERLQRFGSMMVSFEVTVGLDGGGDEQCDRDHPQRLGTRPAPADRCCSRAERKVRMGKKATRRELLLTGAAALVAVPGAAAGKDAHSPVTPTNIEGPFYRPDVPYRTNLRGDDAAGEPFHISGVVTRYPEGDALPDAIVEIWHCNHDGHYDNELPDFDPGKYLLRGKTKADARGRYVFETNLPVPYGVRLGQNRPAHVHYKVFAEGCAPLTTQLYFEGDPNLDSDPCPRKGLVKRLQRHEAPEELRKHGLGRPFFSVTFDIVLERVRKVTYSR